jgi:hypothetical protein
VLRKSIWCSAGCIILSYSPMPTSCIVSCCTIILYQCHMPSAVHMVCRLYNTVCTMILYQCHMLSAVHMVCRLYNTVIQSNANQLYCVLLYNYLIPMPHAIGSPMVCRLYNTVCIIILYQCHMSSAVHMVCRVNNTVCTIILYQCHMLSAVHIVCRLYNTVIQSNADQLYCVLLYNYLIPMPHAIGSLYGVPTV